MDVEAIADEYAAYLASWVRSDRTLTSRTTIVRSRLRAWGLEGMTAQNIQRWLMWDDKRNKRRAAWTSSTYFGHLRCFTEWAVAAGYLAESPMGQVKKPETPRGKPRPLNDTEVALILDRATGDMRAWIILALHAGLRSHEIAKIRGEDVSQWHIHVVGKGGKEADLPTSPEIWELAQHYPRTGYWFPSPRGEGGMHPGRLSHKVSVFFESLGIPGSLHRCRHTFGTRLLRSGVHIRTVQTLMRHESLQTTANYTAVDDDEMRSAVLRLSWSPPPLAS